MGRSWEKGERRGEEHTRARDGALRIEVGVGAIDADGSRGNVTNSSGQGRGSNVVGT